jgi:hypothetical protein
VHSSGLLPCGNDHTHANGYARYQSGIPLINFSTTALLGCFPKSLEALGMFIRELFPRNSCCSQVACSSAGRLRSTAKASAFWLSYFSQRRNAFRGPNRPSAMKRFELCTLCLSPTRSYYHCKFRTNCQLAVQYTTLDCFQCINELLCSRLRQSTGITAKNGYTTGD